MHYFYPERLGAEQAEALKQRVTARLMPMLDILDAQIEKSGGPYLLGVQYTIADIFLFMMCRWTRAMPNPVSLTATSPEPSVNIFQVTSMRPPSGV